MAQRNSLRGARRGVVSMVLGALASMMHKGAPVQLDSGVETGSRSGRGSQRINWLKLALNSQR